MMSVIIPDCTSCKHIDFKKKKNGQLCCTAFPDGIPKEYFWGKINVKELSECANNVCFEENK